MRIDLDVQGINEVNQAFKQVSARFSKPDTRRQIAQAAIPIVIPAIQGATPISSKEHKRYNTQTGKQAASAKGLRPGSCNLFAW
jgi:hypothetical protein